MGAVTAAVIAGAATMASTGAGIAAQQGAFGGGNSGGNGNYSRTPMDPHQRAMRDYYSRMVVENQDKTYPGFGEFLSSGGDPAKAEFDLTTPGMKPSEAAALGLVGGRGEAIPYYDPSTGEGSLTPEQKIYIARERRRHAAETGSKMPQWTHSEAVLNARDRYARRRTRLEEASAIPEEERTVAQRRAANRLPGKLENMESRWPKLDLRTTGAGPGAPRKVPEEDDGSPLKRILTGGTSGGG